MLEGIEIDQDKWVVVFGVTSIVTDVSGNRHNFNLVDRVNIIVEGGVGGGVFQ